MTILAIDPGTTETAWCLFRDGLPRLFAKEPNAAVRLMVGNPPEPISLVAIEMVASYGMPVGREVFETVRWIGRFEEMADPVPVVLVYRQEVKRHLCRSSKANDATIRQALLDRFGPGREAAIGTKKAPGPLYGVSGDVWSALAIACVVSDRLASGSNLAPTADGPRP